MALVSLSGFFDAGIVGRPEHCGVVGAGSLQILLKGKQRQTPGAAPDAFFVAIKHLLTVDVQFYMEVFQKLKIGTYLVVFIPDIDSNIMVYGLNVVAKVLRNQDSIANIRSTTNRC
ncbi:hypothetical protein [Marinobacter sp.]|uniref:hypothetical protein n=1 Tax=Marinobacter sp. TaxID=50741 RepID=UPI00384E877C